MPDWYNQKVWFLHHTINVRGRCSWNTVAEDGRIAALQQDTQPSPKVPHCLPLLLPCLACKSCSQLPYLPHCCRVPAAKGLYSQGKEGNSLSPAVLCCSPRLPVKGEGEGIARCGCSFSNGGPLERNDSY